MPPRARALWYLRPGEAQIQDEALAPLRDGEVIARALATGISRGTESLVFEGRVPANQHARMRAPNMGGEFSFPVKYGYAWVGETIETMPRRVFALQPHQSHCVLSLDALVLVPEGVPDARATLAANMETALNGIWDAQLRPGASVTVIGAGVVGSLVAHLCLLQSDCEVEVVDLDPARRERVLGLGGASRRAHFAEPGRAREGRDHIFHCSGAPAGLRLALRLAAFEGRITEMSWYGDREVSLPLGEDFHSRRLCIQASQVGHVAPSKREHVRHIDRLRLALGLLDASCLDALIGEQVAFEQLPGRIAELFNSPGAHHVVRYDAPSE